MDRRAGGGRCDAYVSVRVKLLKPKSAVTTEVAPSKLTVAELDAKIAPLRLELADLKAKEARVRAELASLERIKKAKLGGLARAGLPRRRKVSDEKICATVAEYGGRGAVTATAAQLNISRKTVWRALVRKEQGH